MSIAPIDAVAIGRIHLPEVGVADAPQRDSSFMQMLGSAASELNGSLIHADGSVRALAAGENIPMQDVMIAMEQAHLKLQFAVEVRNRLIDAYQNLTNMQL